MPSTPRAVLFDFGGVIMREDPALYDDFAVPRGLQPGQFYDLLYESQAGRDVRSGRISVDVWRAATIERFREFWGDDAERTLESWFARPPQLHQATLDLALELQAADIRIGIVSNASGDLEARLGSHFGIDLDWDLVLASGNVGMMKPDPRVFQLAAERIGVPVSDCFVIDDRLDYLQGAIAIGMPSHHFQGDHAALRADLAAHGYPVAPA